MPVFADIQGQDRAISWLTRAVTAERVPHAFLFAGPDGVGKKKTALALAAALNCDRPSEGTPCGACPPCVKIERGTHPDVSVISPDGAAILVEQSRDLIGTLSLKAYEGRNKVAVIDGAERMNLSAANALLKTLEEPPPRTILILVSARPDALLSTIVSRCHRVGFAPLSTDVVAGLLREQKGVEGDTARDWAAMSEGSIGRALQMDEEALSLRREFLSGVLARSRPDLGGVFALARESAGGKKEDRPDRMDISLKVLEGVLSDVWRTRCGRGDAVRGRGDSAALVQAARRLTTGDITAIYDAIRAARGLMVRNINKELSLDVIFLASGAS